MKKQIEKGLIKKEDEPVYLYAYEIFLNQTITFSITLAIMIISGEYLGILAFLASFIPLRKYAGGYHANTNFWCIVFSSCIIAIVVIADKLMLNIANAYGNFFSVAMIFMYIYICSNSPVEAINKPLSDHEKKKYRVIVLIICSIEIGIWMLFMIYKYNPVFRVSIFMDFIIVAVTVFAGRLRKKENKIDTQ